MFSHLLLAAFNHLFTFCVLRITTVHLGADFLYLSTSVFVVLPTSADLCVSSILSHYFCEPCFLSILSIVFFWGYFFHIFFFLYIFHLPFLCAALLVIPSDESPDSSSCSLIFSSAMSEVLLSSLLHFHYRRQYFSFLYYVG